MDTSWGTPQTSGLGAWRPGGREGVVSKEMLIIEPGFREELTLRRRGVAFSRIKTWPSILLLRKLASARMV